MLHLFFLGITVKPRLLQKVLGYKRHLNENGLVGFPMIPMLATSHTRDFGYRRHVSRVT